MTDISSTPGIAPGEPPRLTREEADLRYRATGPIADPGALLADFIARSTADREGHAGVLGLRYGADDDQTLDIFLPRGGGAGAPVHIFIHGGYWYQFGKDEWSFTAEALAEAGAIVVVPRYALCPKVGIADIVQQMRTMLAWIWENIGAHGGDRDRIFVSGHSAGGHLAMELLLTDWAADFGLPADILKGVAAISGLYDLRPIRASYVQEQIALTEEDAERLSPLLRIDRAQTPLIVAVAESDPEGFHLQWSQLIERWTELGGAPVSIHLAGHDHLTELYELGLADGVLANAIRTQMGL